MLTEDEEIGSPSTAPAPGTQTSEYDSLVRLGPTAAQQASADRFNKILRLVLLVVSCVLVIAGVTMLVLVVNSKPQITPVILVSLDGFRWDYLSRGQSPNMQKIVDGGVRAQWMQAQFPSKTFPNHYTLVTGLYPESHGIVDNTMWDPLLNASFSMADAAANKDARWWWGEPIWVTAVKQGLASACFFWPGSEAPIEGILPTYNRAYNSAVPYDDRVAQLLTWLRLSGAERPSLLALYFEITDSVAHTYGPDSSQENAAISVADAAIGLLLDGLANISGLEYNIIVVSDHGMTNTSLERVIFLDDYIDVALFQIVDISPNVYIIPGPNTTIDYIFTTLSDAHPNLTIYHKADIPTVFQYSNNRRITPLLGVADLGWEVRLRATFNPKYFFAGDHGFDNRLKDMQATFIAMGPAFKKGYEFESLQNLEVYGIVCHVLQLAPAPNNGTIASVMDIFVETNTTNF